MIETSRLLLRPMMPTDTDDLLLIFSDPEVMASFGSAPFDHSQMERWVSRNLEHQGRHGYGLFSVILKSTRQLIGDCGLMHMDIEGQREVELGYDFRSDSWGQGLATEAAGGVRDFAFRQLGLTRFVSLIRSTNAASRRVAEKIGMAPERELSIGDLHYWLYAQATPVV